MFGERLDLAVAFVGLLADAGVSRGLIGPREASRLWERHLLNCAVLGEVLPRDVDVADIGSGAGLPGLVLALHRPDLRLTLVEPLRRRTDFLAEVVQTLDLPRVTICRARAEELHGKRQFDVVTSRAVAPLARLLDWSMPLVRPGGQLLAIKGAAVHGEVAAASQDLRRHRVQGVAVLTLGLGIVDPPTTAVRVEAVGRSS